MFSNLLLCLIESSISLLCIIDCLHGFANGNLCFVRWYTSVFFEGFLHSSREVGTITVSKLSLFINIDGHINISLTEQFFFRIVSGQGVDACSIVVGSILKSIGNSTIYSIFLTKIYKTEVTNASPFAALSAFVLHTNGQSAVSYLSNHRDCVAALSKCMSSTFATPDYITYFSRVNCSISSGFISHFITCIDCSVVVGALPRGLLILCHVFTDNRNVGHHVVSVSHSSVVITAYVAICTIACIEGNLVEAILQACECLVDVELSVAYTEFCGEDIVVVSVGSSTVDVTIPAFSLTTDFSACLVLQHLACLLEGAVHDERAYIHAWAIAGSNGSSLQSFEELDLVDDNAVSQ